MSTNIELRGLRPCPECFQALTPSGERCERCVRMLKAELELSTLREAMSDITPTKAVLHEVLAERRRQDERHGRERLKTMPLGGGVFHELSVGVARAECREAERRGELSAFLIAHEEFMEAFAETDPVKMRAELVQLAACAVLGIECIDARKGGGS